MTEQELRLQALNYAVATAHPNDTAASIIDSAEAFLKWLKSREPAK